jgi:hypothetical protein
LSRCSSHCCSCFISATRRGGANPYVEQIDRWFGFDALMHGLDQGLSSGSVNELPIKLRNHDTAA